MTPRIAYRRTAPQAYDAMLALQRHVDQSGLDPALLHLVKLRASQLNGCAFCIDMHLAEAVAAGEDQARLHLLAARHHAGVFTDREQAALAWTEAVTRLPDGGVPDARYEQVRAHFSDEEVVKLTMAVVAINGWNRLNVAFETLPASARR